MKKNVIEKEITHEHYKEALFERKQFMHKMDVLWRSTVKSSPPLKVGTM